MKGLSKGRYDETFAGEDVAQVAFCFPSKCRSKAWAGPEGRGRGGQTVKTTLENHKWLKVSLEKLVLTPPRDAIGSPLGPIASPGRYIRPFSKNVDDLKK